MLLHSKLRRNEVPVSSLRPASHLHRTISKTIEKALLKQPKRKGHKTGEQRLRGLNSQQHWQRMKVARHGMAAALSSTVLALLRHTELLLRPSHSCIMRREVVVLRRMDWEGSRPTI